MTLDPDNQDPGGSTRTMGPEPGEQDAPRARTGDRTGDRVGPFRLVSKLGEGGMGVVYAAEDMRLGRTVALKILPPAAVASPERRRRFLREARAASAVMHPGIAAVFEVGEDEGDVYLAMERVEGKTLRAALDERGGPLPAARALAVVRDLARALEHAHRAGVMHRDLKPANVMETPGGAVKILDFGLAKRIGDAAAEARPTGDVATVEGKILGTPGYMAPEQARGAAVDARTDIFALGVILFELLTGERPFQGPSSLAVLLATDRDPAPPPSSRNAAVPAKADAIVLRCLEKRPEDRFATCGELAGALDAALAEIEAAPAKTLEPAATPRRRLVLLAAIVLVVGAAAAAATWQARSALVASAPDEGAPDGSAPDSRPASSGKDAASASAVAAYSVSPNSSYSARTPDPPPPGLPRRRCAEGDPGFDQCGSRDVIAWCDPGGALLACCGKGLVPKGSDGICACPPGGTRVAEARARGCAAPVEIEDRYRAAKGAAMEAAIQCFVRIRKPKGGVFAADFYLTPEGDVFGARVNRSSIPDEEAQRCALAALRSTRFPPPAGEEAGKKLGFGFELLP